MLSGLRTIFFETSLRWLPLEGYGIKKDAIRTLYNKMCEPGGYRYENLDLQANPPVLSTRRPDGGLSACRFGPSSVTIEEKRTIKTVDEFIEAVTTVLGGLSKQDIPLGFFLQECRMQCLAQPNNVADSLELLAAKVANVHDTVDPFRRPPSHFGVRFRFAPAILVAETLPPGTDEEENSSTDDLVAGELPPLDALPEMTDETKSVVRKGFLDIRLETYPEDISQVWMEVTASYPERDPLSLKDSRIVNNIKETHVFLVEHGKQFLDQFDNTD